MAVSELKVFRNVLEISKLAGLNPESEQVEALIDSYMEIDTDRFDSDDINQVVDEVWPEFAESYDQSGDVEFSVEITITTECVKAKRYATREKLKALESSIGFLSNYRNPEDEIVHIGSSINNIDVPDTKHLYELGEINARREELISMLTR